MALSTSPWYGGGYDVWDPFDWRTGSPWDTGRLWRGGAGDETTALAHTFVDWRETDTAHIFTAEIPGARKEDVRVQVVDQNVLEISGERIKEEENVGDTWHRVERRRGSFRRSFRLPVNANLDDIKCSMEHGVLRVVVPKVGHLPQSNVRLIDIS
ncbi:17-class I heat shock protein 3 [Nymphaea thermarum]|nr:17-class I heat shock protein 3 [Nymphaea thermarum]